jgi:hypothetical protein
MGSFARGTAVTPIRDVDLIAVLGGITVDSSRTDPSPRGTLRAIEAAVQRLYHRDHVQANIQRRSVRIAFCSQHGPLRIDLVPAIPDDPKTGMLWVPDRTLGKWIRSDPSTHTRRAAELDAGSDGQFSAVVQTLKRWMSDFGYGMLPKSVLLESLVAESFVGEPDLPTALERTVARMLRRCEASHRSHQLPRIPDPGVPENDLAETCEWSWEQFEHFLQRLRDLHEIATSAREAEIGVVEAARIWRDELGGFAFPATVTPAPPTERLRPHPDLADLEGIYSVDAAFGIEIPGDPPCVYRSADECLERGVELQFRLLNSDVPEGCGIRWTVWFNNPEAIARGDYRVESGIAGPEFTVCFSVSGYHHVDCELLRGEETEAIARRLVCIR